MPRVKEFVIEKALDSIRQLARDEEYRDGYHLGLKQSQFEESGLAIEKEFGQLMFDYVVKNKPETILELGTANGYSAVWFLLGLLHNEKGKIITVDHKDRQPKIWDLLDIPTDRLKFVESSTSSYLENLSEKIDMAFLDTIHHAHAILEDLNLIKPHLSKRAVVFIHDTLGMELSKEQDFDIELIGKSSGMAICTYQGGN